MKRRSGKKHSGRRVALICGLLLVALIVGLLSTTTILLLFGSSSSSEKELEDVVDRGSKWSSALFEEASTNYNNELALLAAELCAKAADTEANQIIKLYDYYGISNVKDYRYESGLLVKLFGDSAFVIGSDRFIINDKTITVVVITARGSVTLKEFISNINNGETIRRNRAEFMNTEVYSYVFAFYNEMMKGIEEYLSEYPELITETRVKLLITGHSLGGAAANLLGASLTAEVDVSEQPLGIARKEDIYVYTFGATNVHINDYNIEEGYENIHNIFNYYDSFASNGEKTSFHASSYFHKYGHIDIYKDERLHFEEGFFPENHLIENYLEALLIQRKEAETGGIIKFGCKDGQEETIYD